jgi:hypothetical protein
LCLVAMVISTVDSRDPPSRLPEPLLWPGTHTFRRALQMVLSPSRRDTCCREYNGVLLLAPTLFILMGYIPWQVQWRALAFNESYDAGDRHLEVMVRSPLSPRVKRGHASYSHHVGRGGGTSDEAELPRTSRSPFGRIENTSGVPPTSGEAELPQLSSSHRRGWCLLWLLGCPV